MAEETEGENKVIAGLLSEFHPLRLTGAKTMETGRVTFKRTTADISNFTDRARKVLWLASLTAERQSREEIQPLDLLIGLVREGSGIAANVLGELSIDRHAVASLASPVSRAPDMLPPPACSAAANAVLTLAKAEMAGIPGHAYVGTEHILLALTHPDYAHHFKEVSVDVGRVRPAVMAYFETLQQDATKLADEALRTITAPFDRNAVADVIEHLVDEYHAALSRMDDLERKNETLVADAAELVKKLRA